MGRKKAVNWVEIKKRYLMGEQPMKIAEDYNVSKKAIQNKAFKEGWTKERDAIKEEVASQVKSDLQELCDVTLRVHTKFMQRLETQMHYIENPYLFDGERPNSLFQTAMNNSVKVMLAAMKAEQEPEELEESPGINIFPDGP